MISGWSWFLLLQADGVAIRGEDSSALRGNQRLNSSRVKQNPNKEHLLGRGSEDLFPGAWRLQRPGEDPSPGAWRLQSPERIRRGFKDRRGSVSGSLEASNGGFTDLERIWIPDAESDYHDEASTGPHVCFSPNELMLLHLELLPPNPPQFGGMVPFWSLHQCSHHSNRGEKLRRSPPPPSVPALRPTTLARPGGPQTRRRAAVTQIYGFWCV